MRDCGSAGGTLALGFSPIAPGQLRSIDRAPSRRGQEVRRTCGPRTLPTAPPKYWLPTASATLAWKSQVRAISNDSKRRWELWTVRRRALVPEEEGHSAFF